MRMRIRKKYTCEQGHSWSENAWVASFQPGCPGGGVVAASRADQQSRVSALQTNKKTESLRSIRKYLAKTAVKTPRRARVVLIVRAWRGVLLS